MVEPKIITIEELISLLPWYQNLDDKTNWQEKYMEQMELVQREVQENINPDDYETVAEANSAGVDYIISKGMAAPKYMYQDILDGFINENLIAYGYWTSSIDMTNQIVWAQMVYMTYPMDNSMITTFGVRPSIVLEDNQVSLKEKITELYAAESINVLVGETASAPIYTVPYYNSNGSMLNYVSDNESVATIDENGTIMGISPGVTTITVSTKDGSNISKTITVNVQELATDIEISTSSVSIMLGETYQIQAKVLPETATNKELSFSSYDSSIASVSNTGLITANSIGKTTIAVMTTDGTDIYKYIYVTVNPVTYVNNNMSSSNNCINEGICGVGTPINMKVNDNQSYLFYVISDTGTEVTMIMSHNLGTPVKWIDSTDYLSVNPAGCGDTSCNDYGPITALNYLNSLTSEWTNVPAIENYTYLNLSNSANQLAYQKLEIKNGEGILTADNDTTNVLKGISRARLLTYEETQISGIGCKTSYYSCPSWLYGNLNSSSPLGYWTLTTPESSLNNTVNIEYLGLINTIRYIYTDYIGVRPVITISK